MQRESSYSGRRRLREKTLHLFCISRKKGGFSSEKGRAILFQGGKRRIAPIEAEEKRTYRNDTGIAPKMKGECAHSPNANRYTHVKRLGEYKNRS